MKSFVLATFILSLFGQVQSAPPTFSVSPGFVIEAADLVVNSDACPCPCPCDKGPCVCGANCQCKDCPGVLVKGDVSYKTLRVRAIREKRDIVVWVGSKPPYSNLTYMSGGIYQAQENLGWIDPWGNKVNQPCRLEFYYQDGKVWLKRTVWFLQSAAPARMVSC